MARGTYERECERRKKLIEREKALKNEYRKKVQLIQKMIKDNDKLESKCRTLQSLISAIPQIPETSENIEERTFIEELEEIEKIINPAIIFRDTVNISTPNAKYSIKAEVVLTVGTPIRDKEQPVRLFGITYTFHENIINREIYSTWGKELEVTPVKSRVDASFKIIETEQTKTMTIGKVLNSKLKVQTSEKGHVIDRIFASDIESTEDAQSVKTVEEGTTNNENIDEEQQNITTKDKVEEKQSIKKKNIKMSLNDEKLQGLLQSINSRTRMVKRKRSYKEDSDISAEEDSYKENKPRKKNNKTST